MADNAPSDIPSLPEVQVRLREVARLLRESAAIDPESRRPLAELVDELSASLASAQVPASEVAHLAESTAHLAEALHHRRDLGLVGAARESFERAVYNAEAHAPFAAGLARRLLEALANLGI